jgi:hypothetical protein
MDYSAPAQVTPVMGMTSLVPALGGLAARFPALYTAIMTWRSQGIKIGAETLYNMARKFGPQFLIAAGILSAQAVTELMLYRATRRRRRMNALNPRALSRATRRLCSFERRSAKVHRILSSLSKKKSYARAC